MFHSINFKLGGSAFQSSLFFQSLINLFFQISLLFRKRSNKKEHLDWKAIDEDLSKKVESVCIEILNMNGRPVRICITEIIKRVGHKSWIEKRELKLPLTTKVINKFLENLKDFMIRKIKWAKKEFLKDHVTPTRIQFTIRAGGKNKTSESLEIQKAIDNAVIGLKRKLEK